MRKLTWKCDGCGATAEGDPREPDNMPKGWKSVGVSYALRDNLVEGLPSVDGGDRTHHLCGDCVDKFVKAINKPSIIAKAA